jgi:hypothetical protein
MVGKAANVVSEISRAATNHRLQKKPLNELEPLASLRANLWGM